MSLTSVFLNMQFVYERMVIWLLNHWRAFLGSVFLILVGIVLNFGYQAYNKSLDEDAHKAFLSVTRVANSEVSSDVKNHPEKKTATEKQKCEALFAAAELFLNKYSSSSFAASAHGYLARACLGLGDRDAARAHFVSAQKSARSLDIKQAYALSVALMDIDSSDDSVRSQGLELLKSLGSNETASVSDAALFYLGQYYWLAKNYQEARLWWGQLLAVADKKVSATGIEIKSPWALMAKDKIALIDC